MRRLILALFIVAGVQSAAAGLVFAQAPAAQAPSRVRTLLTVNVPHKETELEVEGKRIAGTGMSRDFQTPPLEAGKMFEYTFGIKWKPNNYTEITRTRVVRFT